MYVSLLLGILLLLLAVIIYYLFKKCHSRDGDDLWGKKMSIVLALDGICLALGGFISIDTGLSMVIIVQALFLTYVSRYLYINSKKCHIKVTATFEGYEHIPNYLGFGVAEFCVLYFSYVYKGRLLKGSTLRWYDADYVSEHYQTGRRYSVYIGGGECLDKLILSYEENGLLVKILFAVSFFLFFFGFSVLIMNIIGIFL